MLEPEASAPREEPADPAEPSQEMAGRASSEPDPQTRQPEASTGGHAPVVEILKAAGAQEGKTK